MLTLLENKSLVQTFKGANILNRIESLINSYQNFCSEKHVAIKKRICDIPKYTLNQKHINR
jgi:hypothetical protein